jgi:hypothetical protein
MGLVYLGRLSAEADVLPKEAQQSFGLAGPRAKVNVGKEERAVSVRYRGLIQHSAPGCASGHEETGSALQ